MEFWQVNFPIPWRAAKMAARAESNGWDGLAFGDSQCMTGDVYVGMAQAAAATTSLLLSTGVTNPVTRHASVTASAIASIHAASDGRAVLGLGRGDSALGYIGQRPSSLAAFMNYLQQVQRYLRGDPIDIDGYSSTMRWIAERPEPKVRVDVAASGPSAIKIAARDADGIVFALGADPVRITTAIAFARAARAAAGKDPADLTFGSYINMMPHHDIDVARRAVSGAVMTIARFSAAAGFAVDDPVTLSQIRDAAASYNIQHHASSANGHGTSMDDAFIDRFAVVGSPEQCAERLTALEATGLSRVIVLVGGRDGDPADINSALRSIVDDVLPRVRR